MCRVEHLESIAKHYGHGFSRKTLGIFTKFLSKNIGKYGYIGSVDNKEFVVVLPLVDEDEAAAWAAKLRLMVSQLSITYRRETVPITVSVGFASSRHDYNYNNLRALAHETMRRNN